MKVSRERARARSFILIVRAYPLRDVSAASCDRRSDNMDQWRGRAWSIKHLNSHQRRRRPQARRSRGAERASPSQWSEPDAVPIGRRIVAVLCL